MPGSFSLAGLRSLGLEEEVEEDVEEEDKLDPMLEGRPRMPPLVTPATDPVPLLRFLLDTGKGEVEAGLLAELCLLSEQTTKEMGLRHKS